MPPVFTEHGLAIPSQFVLTGFRRCLQSGKTKIIYQEDESQKKKKVRQLNQQVRCAGTCACCAVRLKDTC